MARVYANFFESTLSSQLLVGSTTLLSSGLASFPTVTAPDVAYLVIGSSTDSREIVKITDHASAATAATIVRGQDSTTDRTWNSGTTIRQAPIGTDLSTIPTTYAPIITELCLPPTSLNATVADLNGVPVNTFAPTGTTVAQWALTLPAHWATFDIVIRYCTVGTSGYAIMRADRVFLGVGDSVAVSAGGTANVTASAVTLTVAEQTLASGVATVDDEVFNLRVTRLGDDAGETFAGSIYVTAVLLQQAS